MPSSRPHRQDINLRRRQEKQEAEAKQAQAAQQAAAARRAWKVNKRRHVLAWVLMGLAPVIALTHMLEHVGVFNPFSAGLEDLTIGYPTAAVLFVTGAIVYGRD